MEDDTQHHFLVFTLMHIDMHMHLHILMNSYIDHTHIKYIWSYKMTKRK